jgi:hypothetical protein
LYKNILNKKQNTHFCSQEIYFQTERKLRKLQKEGRKERGGGENTHWDTPCFPSLS